MKNYLELLKKVMNEGEHPSIDQIEYKDIVISWYEPHPAIPGKVAI